MAEDMIMENEENKQPDLKLISDHTDERDNLPKDQLGREDMVTAIAEAILQVEPPFTFGIYGSWGSGKTHFMKSVKKELDTLRDDKDSTKKPITVMFEAWRHQNDEHPEISMLRYLRDELPNYFKEATEVAATTSAGLNTAINSVTDFELNLLFLNMKVSPKKAREEYAKLIDEEREKHFEKIDTQVALKAEFDKAFNDVIQSSSENDRIVFFIDDLDRCLDGTVIKMLEQIKLFLWNKHCVFVLGADHKVIEGVVRKGNYTQGRKYLEKIVNFPFYLPPLGNEVSDNFFKGKITEKEENLKPEEDALVALFRDASIASKANLREMILLANTYKLNNYLTRKAIEKQESGSEYCQQITAVFTVLKTLHEEAFNILCENRSGSEEGENLKAFFTKPAGDTPDPIDLLFAPKSPDPNATAPKEIEGIDSEAINGIRTWVWNNCAKIIEKLTDADLLVYVRFLVSQTEAQNSSEDSNSDSSIWYEKKSWVWYWQNPRVSNDTLVVPAESSREKLRALITPIIKDKERRAQPIVLDNYWWRVIKVEQNENGSPERALLLSEHIIGRGPMDNKPEDWKNYEYSWSKSALYENLKSPEWLEMHLPTLNKSGMIQENHPAEDASVSGPLGKVFLLSTDEVKTLLTEDLAGLRRATTPQGEAGWWWLRSPGYGNSRDAAGVSDDGRVYDYGYHVDYDGGGVRPALWLNLESVNLQI